MRRNKLRRARIKAFSYTTYWMADSALKLLNVFPDKWFLENPNSFHSRIVANLYLVFSRLSEKSFVAQYEAGQGPWGNSVPDTSEWLEKMTHNQLRTLDNPLCALATSVCLRDYRLVDSCIQMETLLSPHTKHRTGEACNFENCSSYRVMLANLSHTEWKGIPINSKNE